MNLATGRVELTPKEKLSHAGNKYVQWTMANRTKRFVCRAFRENVTKALKLKHGEEVTVQGKFEESESDPDLVTVMVNTLGYADEKKQAKQARKQKDNSFVTEQDKERMLRKGIVYARVEKGFHDWCRKEHAFELQEGIWISKIYFILEMLGAEKVNEILRQEGVGISENLKHFDRIREDLFGLAMTAWENGIRPKQEEED
jgi:RecG-like helicase